MNKSLAIVVLVFLSGCMPQESTAEHTECPEPGPAMCATVDPPGFDEVAFCAEHGAALDSTWTGRMCASDGCPDYPPEDAQFLGWFLCDGVPVEVWCQ